MHGSLSFDNRVPDGKAAAYSMVKAPGLRFPLPRQLQLGENDFSISAWVYTDAITNDFPGDIISQYDLKKKEKVPSQPEK